MTLFGYQRMKVNMNENKHSALDVGESSNQ